MSIRNAVYREALAILEEDGLNTFDANAAIVHAMEKQSFSSYGSGQVLCGSTLTVHCDQSDISRSFDGICNNLISPHLGSAGIKMARYLPQIPKLHQVPTYTNINENPTESGQISLNDVHMFGVNSGECSAKCTEKSETCVKEAKVELPSARLVTTTFFNYMTAMQKADGQHTHMLTQWGQFLDHDITLTPVDSNAMCNGCWNDATCMPIKVPHDDPYYKDSRDCIEFKRSTEFCESASHMSDVGQHEQMNIITAFIDGSNIYESSELENRKMRMKPDGCHFKTTEDNLLLNKTQKMDGKDETVLLTGDVRAGEMPGLATMHTIFVREHNRLCDRLLKEVGDKMIEEDELFQEVRKIVIAEMQKIVYSDYLPIVLGPAYNPEEVLVQGDTYDENADPSIANSFATAAYRFGHSMVQGNIKLFDSHLKERTGDDYKLSESFFSIYRYLNDMESILAGLLAQPSLASDRFVTEELGNNLFANVIPDHIGLDLIALNIQRGRDHGLPSYAAFYKKFVNSADGIMDCWGQKPDEISDDNWKLLEQVYRHPHHIDLFVGGLAENPVEGGLTGPTFSAIIMKQFKSLKDGDRFFFTHKMNKEEYDQIMKRTLADIICQNSDMQIVPKNVFLANKETVSCNSLTDIDLKPFIPAMPKKKMTDFFWKI